MGKELKIAFITDLHIGAKGENTRDIDVRNNLKATIKAVNKTNCDYVVIGGDVCFKKPQDEIYMWAKKQLDKLQKPYFLISGNHDDSKMLSRHFKMNIDDGKIYYQQVFRAKSFIFLDSSAAVLGERQWKWLTNIFQFINQEDVFIFMHHPPIAASVPYMDNKHAFQESERFEQLIQDHPEKRFHIFCGHYHVDKCISKANAQIRIFPSLFFQIDQYNPNFQLDHINIGYGMISIENEKVTNTTHYL